ncbi:uncharacterized protein BCR38DRAFT_484500 [Pseudomassariella vexata]|uniref:Uncharacterized protein n=1 Tax=Pseudomassariella vexata TaxID=1141098 RepID=A0A1Y2E114_9PEZI|nr:uncharacterized protein BCR38DRAFT_484500 [Pseudomassariella vexata]ORY65026.1 hypothetical protein BCR38DRAFT_484500 [Pseudomassariella vexata]
MEEYTMQLAELHQNNTSTNVKYRFSIDALVGASQMDNRWRDTWEELLASTLKTRTASGPPDLP